MHALAGFLGHAGRPLQAKHNPPAALVQSKDMLHRPTHPTANHSPAPDHGPEPQKEAVEKGHSGPSYRAPRQLHPQTPGAPQPAGHPHPHMAHHGPPSSPAGHPSTKVGPHPNQRRLRPPCRSPAPPQPADQGPKPGAKIQGNPKAAPQEDPLRGPQKAREPTEPKPKPIRKPRPIHPETNPGQPTHSNHADPSEPPSPDRKVTGVSNWNQDKEPETKLEPPKTKRRPQPSKANHPSPPKKETYTHPNIQTTPRAHKTLDTQVDPAPPPPTDPPPRQQNVLLEGRGTCNEMGPTRQFGKPLCPPIHQRSRSQGRVPGNAPAQNPGDISARTQDPQGPARTPARGGDKPQEPQPGFV
ncbi:basic salivary proline-rich protein 1-like [Girardinichthys multiradiatus]|uniref:basic salivary proline-rich protein 1-like n=1 Tax=Girardinichthys multiradiatus TaxID=208333 RepID=UPI001FACEBCA|nr:basic salivary proline-rich protein 1-like [Girardinichthys multiradiatus]